MNTFSTEWFKAKRRKLYLAPAALLVIQLFWLFWALRDPDPEVIAQGYLLILYNAPLINGIMMPTIMAVLASRLADVEHKGQTFKLLNTLQRPSSLYWAKAGCGAAYILGFCLIQITMLLLMGRVLGYTDSPDLWAYGLYFAQTLVISLEIFLLQLDLSLGVRNQAFSLGVGLCGSMAGLFLMFMPQWPLLRLLTPWGHFGATMFVGNMWSAETPVISLYYMPVDWVGCFMALVGLVLFAVVGRTILARKEV